MTDNKKEYEKTVSHIIDMIKTGELTIGSKLPSERNLAIELGISRNSIREALRTLENMGVIESRQGSGNYVTCEISNVLISIFDTMLLVKKREWTDIFNFRKSMDKMVCAMLIEQKKDLNRLADMASEILDEKPITPEMETEIDNRFHFFLIEATENELLIALLNSVSPLYKNMIGDTLSVANDKMKTGFLEAHRRIVAALRTGSKEACDRAVENHYKHVYDVVKQSKNG